MKPVDTEIQKPIIKSILPKKVKFRLVIEIDTIITYTEVLRL